MSDIITQRISDLQKSLKDHIQLQIKLNDVMKDLTQEEKNNVYNSIYFYIAKLRQEAWELFVHKHTGLSNKMLGKEHNYLYSLFMMDFEKDMYQSPLPVKETDMPYLLKRLQEIKLTPPPLDS